MNSPQSGFRRAAVASWALAGLGVAGVAGVSALAYADTVKPAAAVAAPEMAEPVQASDPAQAPVTAVLAAPRVDPSPAPAVTAQPVSDASAPAYTPAPKSAPVPTYSAPAPAYTAPAYTAPSAPAYTPPAPVYTAPPVVQPQPAPVVKAPSQSGFQIRQSNVPVGGGRSSSGNKFSPPHTASRGS